MASRILSVKPQSLGYGRRNLIGTKLSFLQSQLSASASASASASVVPVGIKEHFAITQPIPTPPPGGYIKDVVICGGNDPLHTLGTKGYEIHDKNGVIIGGGYYAADGKTIIEQDVFKQTGPRSATMIEQVLYTNAGVRKEDILYDGWQPLSHTLYDADGITIKETGIWSDGHWQRVIPTPTPINPSWSNQSGYGEINVVKSLGLALGKNIADIAPVPSTLPSYLTETGFQAAWAAGYTGKGVTVAAIDPDGFDAKVFQGKLSASSYNFEYGQAEVFDVGGSGHGTKTASLIVGGYGQAGGPIGAAYDAKLMAIQSPVRGPDSSNAYYETQSINYAVEHGAKVISMSLAYPELASSDQIADLRQAIKNAYEKNVVVVISAGNDHRDMPDYPALFAELDKDCIAAGAIDQGRMANFSNLAGHIEGNFVDAPGTGGLVYGPGGAVGYFSGTSMSAPLVAAEAAILFSAKPELSAKEVIGYITQGCRAVA